MADGGDNLLLGGHCVSSTHETNGSVRITASRFASGEAAGMAAVLAARDGRAAHAVNLPELRATLRGRAAIL
ncbi:MAG: FAD-dependent oxidoreductase [Nocardioidaceae bacterium]